MVLTLYVSNHVCQKHGIGYSDTPLGDEEAYHRCLNTLGINETSLDVITVDLKKEMARVESRGLF